MYISADVTDSTAIYTIGQGGRNVAVLAHELKRRNIGYLCDVRSVPISNHAPEFCRDELRHLLNGQGVTYVWMGETLGGRPADRSLYTSEGYVDYTMLIDSPAFQSGLDRLQKGMESGHRLAIFCSEGEPERCHRSKAVGAALERRGVRVTHIDPSGDAVPQSAVMARLASQMPLFEGAPNPATISRGRYI